MHIQSGLIREYPYAHIGCHLQNGSRREWTNQYTFSHINLLYKGHSLHLTVITHLFKFSLMVSHADSDILSWQLSHLQWEMIPNLIVLIGNIGQFLHAQFPSIKMEWGCSSKCDKMLLIVYLMSCNMRKWRFSITNNLYFNSEATLLKISY